MKGSGCSKYIRRNNVFNLGYHIIFCPKYRKPYLLRFESLLRECILKTSIKFQFLVAEIDIMPDHIHLFIKCKTTTMPISKIIGHLKGFSSYTIRKKFPKLKKYKAFWSNSYFVESIGNMSELTIRKYIKNQKINVKSSYKYKDMVSAAIVNITSSRRGQVIGLDTFSGQENDNVFGTSDRKMRKNGKNDITLSGRVIISGKQRDNVPIR